MAGRSLALESARARTASRSTAVRISGLDRVIRKLDLERDAIQIMSELVGASADIVLGEARRRAPVDTSLLKTSLNKQTRVEDEMVVANIGTNVSKNGKPYGAFMEFGTGSRNDHPNWPKAAVSVPAEALVEWAARKSRGGRATSAFLVARAISRRGGLEPRRYLRGSLEIYESDIRQRLSRVVDEIKRKRGL